MGILSLIIVLGGAWFLFVFFLLCNFAPFIGYPLLGLIVLYGILATLFPGLVHGKYVYRGAIYVLRDDFVYFKNHTRRWNLKERLNFHSIKDEIYVQLTWNPLYCMEIASGKVLRMRTFYNEFFTSRPLFYVDGFDDTVDDVDKIEEYLNSEGREAFGEYLTDLQKKAKETYKEAKKHPRKTKKQTISQTIRDYRRIHKKGEK